MPPLAAGEDDGDLARGCRAGGELGEGAAGGGAGEVLDGVALEDLEALGAGK